MLLEIVGVGTGITVITNPACIPAIGRFRPNDDAELRLEACDCRRVVEEGAIIVDEWHEAIEHLNIPVANDELQKSLASWSLLLVGPRL